MSAEISWEEPSDFKPKFRVVSAYILVSDRFLLLLRNEDKSEGNKWGVPGGKIDDGETPGQAVRREIAEETGIELAEERFDFFKTAYVRYPDYDFIFHMYSARLEAEPSLVVSLSEHQEARWMTPEEALSSALVMGNEVLVREFFKTEQK
jgi:8-oxo-dGTP diphosphatase